MAQQDRAIRTRQAILEAAGEVFAECGYSATRISDVYQRCGVTKGAFYFHFTSKAELAQAVLDEQVAAQFRYFAPPQEPGAPKVQEWVDVTLLVAHRLTFDRMLQGSIRLAVDQGHDVIDRKVPYQAWIEVSTRLLGEAQELGELVPGIDVATVSDAAVGAFTGVQLLSEIMTNRADVEERIAVLYDLMARSLARPEVYARLDITAERGKRLTRGDAVHSSV
ncbi:ScbR family autoregulator-binding transcription factor [Streptomyces sp. NPDC057798]|uniref:ScbR family autoregulator-binding transcription factor n=1 Tax=Streptomyces sp. NPDC057798 TaxID=3346252 RepID=UPI00367CF1D8